MRPITINLPTWMIHEMEDLALNNKRNTSANRSVSASQVRRYRVGRIGR